MKDQVTSIEQSRALLELGVPAEKASMVWVRIEVITYDLEIWETCAETKNIIWQDFSDRYTPAFTVADQQELLPVFIDAKGTFYLNISKCYEGWCVSYETESGAELISHRGTKLVDVLMDATEWLLSNGYKLNL